MSRRPAKFTQADYARATRAAKLTGTGPVEFRPDGTILINVSGENNKIPVEPEAEVVL